MTPEDEARARAAHRYPAIAAGHKHAEAFNLMWYVCRCCGHKERIWNSRDGVTPFGTACPSCGHLTLQHEHFHLDQYAPEHVPGKGQRKWVTMSEARARSLAENTYAHAVGMGHAPVMPQEGVIASMAQDIYREGTNVDLEIHGYTEVLCAQ